MMTAMTGRPISGRSTTRSSPKPRTTMPATASSADGQNGKPAEIAGPGGDEAGEHDELALGEIDRVGRLVDQHETERDQRVHQPDHDAVDDQGQRELPVDPSHRSSGERLARRAAEPVTASIAILAASAVLRPSS